MGSGKWMYFVLAGTLGNLHGLSDGISVFVRILPVWIVYLGPQQALMYPSYVSLASLLSVSCPSVFFVGSGLPLEPVLGSGSGFSVSQSVSVVEMS